MAVVTSRVRRTCTCTCFAGFVPNPPVFTCFAGFVPDPPVFTCFEGFVPNPPVLTYFEGFVPNPPVFTCFEGFVPNPPVFASGSAVHSKSNKAGVVGRFYSALGSALEQTQCAHTSV